MDIKVYDSVVWKTVEQIHPYENNARVNDEAIDALVKDIPIAGFNVPLVVDKDGVIVKGHSRFEALKRLGIDLIPCIVIDGSPEDIAEERLVDNKISELSSWDEDKLAYERREMQIDLARFNIKLPSMGSPAMSVTDTTPAQVEHAKTELVGEGRQTQAERKSFVEIHCPHCGEDFFADLKEVEKYAD